MLILSSPELIFVQGRGVKAVIAIKAKVHTFDDNEIFMSYAISLEF